MDTKDIVFWAVWVFIGLHFAMLIYDIVIDNIEIDATPIYHCIYELAATLLWLGTGLGYLLRGLSH